MLTTIVELDDLMLLIPTLCVVNIQKFTFQVNNNITRLKIQLYSAYDQNSTTFLWWQVDVLRPVMSF